MKHFDFDQHKSNFYVDPEIFEYEHNGSQSMQSNPKILSFPTKDSGAFAASFPSEYLFDSYNPFSFGASFMSCSCDENIKINENENKKKTIIETVVSPQITKFWELYQKYPKYLKNVQKRQKRRNKKRTSQIKC